MTLRIYTVLEDYLNARETTRWSEWPCYQRRSAVFSRVGVYIYACIYVGEKSPVYVCERIFTRRISKTSAAAVQKGWGLIDALHFSQARTCISRDWAMSDEERACTFDFFHRFFVNLLISNWNLFRGISAFYISFYQLIDVLAIRWIWEYSLLVCIYTCRGVYSFHSIYGAINIEPFDCATRRVFTSDKLSLPLSCTYRRRS